MEPGPARAPLRLGHLDLDTVTQRIGRDLPADPRPDVHAPRPARRPAVLESLPPGGVGVVGRLRVARCGVARSGYLAAWLGTRRRPLGGCDRTPSEGSRPPPGPARALLDAIRQEVLDARGDRDGVHPPPGEGQRIIELGSRAVLLASRRRVRAWLVGDRRSRSPKVLDNMEIGHNVLHGQWDWMRDPKIHSTTWEWDHTSPAVQWKRAHNETHHPHTNVPGKGQRPRLRDHARRRGPGVGAAAPAQRP